MDNKRIGYVELTLKFEQEGRRWVGTCLEMDTSTFNRTLKKTREDLKLLVTEHLDLLEEEGERDRFFRDWGIKLHPAKPRPHDVHIKGTWLDWYGPPPADEELAGPFFQPGVFEVRRRELANV